MIGQPTDDNLRMQTYNLATGLFDFSRDYPDLPAIEVDDKVATYSDLVTLTRRIAGKLLAAGIQPGDRVGVLGRRSVDAVASTFAVCWVGGVWVPLNPTHPSRRLNALIGRAQLDVIVHDDAGAAVIAELGQLPTCLHVAELSNFEPCSQYPVPREASDIAYMMFTSGTTGAPKGVMNTHLNAAQFLSTLQGRCSIAPGDRVSHFFELNFDVSVFDLFLTLSNGGCLVVLPDSMRQAPAKFIKEMNLTIWCSVPSAIVMMDRFKQLQPDCFPTIRYSMFCGESLPVEPVRRWMQATPNGITDNMYGPTETTVVCTMHQCGDDMCIAPERGNVAIGKPFPGTEAMLVNSSRECISDNEPGEIWIAGEQVCKGYWRDEATTLDRFVEFEGKRWYRTGDLGRRDEDGVYYHLGRTDNQVQLFGHRVELEDVDAHLRAACECETALTVAWPVESGSAQGLVAFVAGCDRTIVQIRMSMKTSVPDYMIPRQFRMLDSLPLSANGKFDRNALLRSLTLESES